MQASWLSSCLSFCFLYLLWFVILTLFSSFFLSFFLLFYCFLISGSLSLSSVFSFLAKLPQVHQSFLQMLRRLFLLLCCLECFLVFPLFSLFTCVFPLFHLFWVRCVVTLTFSIMDLIPFFQCCVSALRHCCLQHKEGSKEGHVGEFWPYPCGWTECLTLPRADIAHWLSATQGCSSSPLHLLCGLNASGPGCSSPVSC